jgi:hypothetical protein
MSCEDNPKMTIVDNDVFLEPGEAKTRVFVYCPKDSSNHVYLGVEDTSGIPKKARDEICNRCTQ